MSLRPLRRTSGLLAVLLCGALYLASAATEALAAPHNGDPFPLRQPDGVTVDVLVWGDEFYQRIESLDGYTLIRDPDSGVIVYAELSADGTQLIYIGIGEDGGSQLFLRPMDEADAVPVAGTEGSLVMAPFLSPDGQRLGFYADQQLRTVPVR